MELNSESKTLFIPLLGKAIMIITRAECPSFLHYIIL